MFHFHVYKNNKGLFHKNDLCEYTPENLKLLITHIGVIHEGKTFDCYLIAHEDSVAMCFTKHLKESRGRGSNNIVRMNG